MKQHFNILSMYSKKSDKKIKAYTYMNRVYRSDNIKNIKPAYIQHKIPKKYLFPNEPHYDKYIPYSIPQLITMYSLSFTNEYLSLLKKPTKKQLLFIDKAKREITTQLIGMLFWNCTKTKYINNGYKANKRIFSNDEYLSLNDIVSSKQQLLSKSIKAIVKYYNEKYSENNCKYAILDYKKVKQAFINCINASMLVLSSKGNTHFKNCSSFYNISTNKSNVLYYLFNVIQQKYNLFKNNIENFFRKVRANDDKLLIAISGISIIYNDLLEIYYDWYGPPA